MLNKFSKKKRHYRSPARDMLDLHCTPLYIIDD